MIISQSRLKTWRRCRKKHDYKHNRDLARKVRAAPLLRGTILHEMIQAKLQKTEAPKSVLLRYAKKYRQLFRIEQETYGETFIEDIGRVYEGYERAYVKDPLNHVHVEKAGCVELPNGIEFHYIVDSVATDKNKRRWLVDRKSHKNIPSEQQRAADIQLVLYYWAWNLEHPKEPVDGILWDYLRTKPPTIPEQLKNGELTQRKNIDTDFWTYANELRNKAIDPRPYADTLARLQERGSVDFFLRVSLPAPPKELVLSVVADAADTAAEIVEFGKKSKTRNLTKDCSFDCEFFQLCHAELRGLDSDFVRKANYQEKDPDERYQKDSEEGE